MTKELDAIAEIGRLAYQINAIAKEGVTSVKVSVELTKRNGIIIFVDGTNELEGDVENVITTRSFDSALETLKGIHEASKYKAMQFLRGHETKVTIALAEVRKDLKQKYGIELNQTSWNKIFKECMDNWEVAEDGTEDKRT